MSVFDDLDTVMHERMMRHIQYAVSKKTTTYCYRHLRYEGSIVLTPIKSNLEWEIHGQLNGENDK